MGPAGTPALDYRRRLADVELDTLLDEFAAVMITGPRACGKTTTGANRAASIVRLDEPDAAATFRADPDAALRRAATPVLLDEWQEVPEVLGAVKRAVDAGAPPGEILLTGSVRAELANETWAGTGRVMRLGMVPVVERERLAPDRLDDASFLARLARSGIDELRLASEVPDIDGYVAAALRSGYPEIAYRDRSDRARSAWLTSYVDDLVTRDAALLDTRKDPDKLRRYLTVLALSTGGQPAAATLYDAAGVNAKTAAGYDQLLSNLFVLDLVPAWSNNRLRRLARGPKRYLIDAGLAAAAAGLTATHVLDDPDLVGRWFDTFATAQIRAELASTHPRPGIHHLRADGGRREVDLVVELNAREIVALEFKAGVGPTAHDARHLRWLRDEIGAGFAAGAVLHTGSGLFQLDDRIFAVPLCAIWG